MSEKRNSGRGGKTGLTIAICAVLICALVVIVPWCQYTAFEKAHPRAGAVFGIQGLHPGIVVIKPGEHGVRTILQSYDAMEMYYPLDFRLTPCEDKSDKVYLTIIFYTKGQETERTTPVRVIMRSPTRYYVEGDDREYEAYSDNPDWMTWWESAEIPAVF